MKKSHNKLWPLSLTLLFGIATFMFWRFRYPHAMAYQEQFQLFLLTTDYLRQALAVPAGFSRYVAEAIVQFYNNVTVGALLLALLFMLLQRLTWRLCRKNDGSHALSFLPAIVMLYAMGDENVMLTSVVALIIVLIGILLTPRGYSLKSCVAYVLIPPIIYWTAGPMAFLMPVYILLRDLTGGKKKSILHVSLFILHFIYLITLLLTSSYIVPYSLQWLAMGIGYYRFPLVISYATLTAASLAVVVPFIRLPHLKQTEGIATAAVAVLSVLLIPRGYDAKKYELIRYDYLVRTGQWQSIIAFSEQKQPDLPMSVCATNLALGMTGQLGDRAFQFFQRGSEGLLPPFERNFASTMLTGEAYWHLGLVNTAQRFAFEAMEALPNYNKSCRAVKRLVETNLVNGHYDVARKYLTMLSHTMFYSRWAERTQKLLGDEKAIDSHPVYGRLRTLRIGEDFLFSESETDKMFGQLYLRNNENHLAMQYLLLAPLLDRDIPRFMRYLPVVQQHQQYFPTICQQAVAFAYMQQRQQPPRGIISEAVLDGMNRFMQAVAAGKDSPQMQAFQGTLWYYLAQ